MRHFVTRSAGDRLHVLTLKRRWRLFFRADVLVFDFDRDQATRNGLPLCSISSIVDVQIVDDDVAALSGGRAGVGRRRGSYRVELVLQGGARIALDERREESAAWDLEAWVSEVLDRWDRAGLEGVGLQPGVEGDRRPARVVR